MIVNIPTPVDFVRFQIEHYSDLLKNVKSIKARMHVRRELYNFKQQLKTLLN